jgi:carboxypeptidase family protein
LLSLQGPRIARAPRGLNGVRASLAWGASPRATSRFLSSFARLLLLSVLALGPGCRPASTASIPATARAISHPRELLWGPCAAGKLGDIAMENGRIIAVISQKERSSGFATTPGNLVDLAPLPGGEDHLSEMFLYINDEFPRQAHYARTEIVDPGGGRRAAIVRASGVDSKDARIKIETEYRLEPDAPWLTVTSRFTSSATATVARYKIGDALQWGRTQSMAPGYGFGLPGRRVQVDWIAGIGEGTSYALVPEGQRKFDTPSGSMWSDPVGAVTDLLPNRTFAYTRYVVVGRGDTASMASTIAKLRGDATGRVGGSVLSEERAPIADAMVRILDSAGAVAGLAHADETGAYAIDLAPGRYRALASAPGRTTAASRTAADGLFDLHAGDRKIFDFTLGARATLSWRIEGDDGRAPPVRLTVVALEGSLAPDFGPIFRADGAENVILSPRGVGETPIGAGRYRVIVSRGPEFEIIERIIQAAPGGAASLTGRLERSVATRGFISTDVHQHAAPSFDSGVSLDDRALSNAAEGIEVLISTDHNVIVDYRPVIAQRGLGRSVTSIIGTEATTHSVGHFNAFPLRFSAGALRGGMIDPEGLSPRQIFDVLRGLGESTSPPFIQANHPRAGAIGYFDLMGLDPTTGLARDARFTPDFDGVEVLSFGRGNETRTILADWFSLLRRGHRITAVGGSDSHAISIREVGWPRTFVCVDNDDPPHLDARGFIESLRRGCATVSGGPFVVIRSGVVRMGGLVSAHAGRFEISIDVSAASWIPTDQLTIFVDGVQRRVIPLESHGIHRYTGTLSLECKSDCFVVALVESDKDLSPVIAKRPDIDPRPLAVTNPIYVDIDGDGAYAPKTSEPARRDGGK